MAFAQLPAGIPVGISQLIQTNMLNRALMDGLAPYSVYQREAERRQLPPHTGQTTTMSKLGMFDVDLKQVDPTGPVPFGQWNTEQFTAQPFPYGKSWQFDGPTAYVQAGNYAFQGMQRLGEWAGRTNARLARGKLYQYAGGTAIVRRTQTTADSVLLVNSLSGFRKALNSSGSLVDVSSTNTLAITIVAATTFTALVTGTTPFDANFPDGPGQLTLSTTLSANVAAQSYIVAATAPKKFYAAGRASSEALTTSDVPKVKNVLDMKAYLRGKGVMPQADGTYHLHVDETFFPGISQDTQWQSATQGSGPTNAFGPNALFVPMLGLTIIEVNDSPAVGRSNADLAVGSSAVTIGATGAAGSSLSMQDIGLDVQNSSGVGIRRAIMIGAEAMIETYIDEMLYESMMGVVKVGPASSALTVFQGAGGQYVAGDVEGWKLAILPALDQRGLTCTFTVSKVFDYTLTTDRFSAVSADTKPIKRACVLEYGNNEG